MNYNFLQDRRFLQQLDALRIKQQFVKITVLNWREQPLEEIQGIAISGSVNLDGSSSMRRTANLSIFAEEKDNNLANIDNLFSVNKKCILELGIVNKVPEYIYKEKDEYNNINFININYQELYGDIIWFPLGVYVMFNPSISHSMSGVTISMQLKDKMCLLNGDLGGEIHSAVQFSNQDELVDADAFTLEKNPVLVYNIIKELVNHWGNQQLNKIIISQVPLQIKHVVKWTGLDTIYIVQSFSNSMIFTSQDQAKAWCEEKGLSQSTIFSYNPGQDVGFTYEDFVYPGELTCNAGETVTSVLDKLISIMGNYEYFYDVFGNFRFQEKQNYLNMTNVAYWTKEENFPVGNLPSDVYQADYYRLTKSVYDFTDNEYTTTYNNSLNYNNIKNDFVVWGSYPTANSNTRIPCRFHLAIDKKPSLNNHDIALYYDSNQITRAVWYNSKTQQPSIGTELFPNAVLESAKGKIYKIITNRVSKDWREEIYYQMLEDEYIATGQNTEKNNSYFQYYAELKQEFPKIYNLETQKYSLEMQKHPNEIGYFLDFIDENSQLGNYSVSNIGRRAKIIADNNEGINCVFEPQIPDIVYVDASKYTESDYIALVNKLISTGQNWTQIPNELYSLFSTGGVLNSCFEKIKDLLYQYTHVNNTISITTLPIYYLQPNTRITVEDSPAGIYGDYIIQSISLPLDISSTMTINAYKALQKI